MTQEDKELLLKDLCARLPYGVRCKLIYNNKPIKDEDATLFGIDKYGSFLFAEFGEDTRNFVCKPYLFPMSSMTEEQKEEYRKVCELDTEILSKHPMDDTPFPALYYSQDWLDAHHFDYRGLIPMGLAIDATELNIY